VKEFAGMGKGGRLNKIYQIAHIYPNSPTEHQRLVLNVLEKLGAEDCVAHESIDITYCYAHVFTSTRQEVADKLGKLFMNCAGYIGK